MTIRKLALGGAILSLLHAGSLQAADTEKCLTIEQAEALVTYLLPKGVEASRTQCADSLPASSALMVSNSEQLAKYNAASEGAWPAAKSAVGVLAGDKLPTDIDDALLRPIADAMFTQMIAKEIKAKDCSLINKIYSDLEPMPPTNIASLAITIVQAATKDDEKQDIPICQAPA